MISDEHKVRLKKQEEEIAKNMGLIKHRIVVFSGKGGVGKTTVSIAISYGLNKHNYKAGLLDADITGPNVPKMLGLDEEVHSNNNKIEPLYRNGLKIISTANMIAADQAVAWRGPMRSRLLYQFLGRVNWGKLDYLVADLPPGTGDEIITLTQEMKPDMAVIVTTPQTISLIDSARAVYLAKEMKIPNIGIIENMSGFICPKCKEKIDIFDVGGGEKQAKELSVSYLGNIPLDIETRKTADLGKFFNLKNTDSSFSNSISAIVENIESILEN
ncbi:MAG: Mrp/NBP35 family ATP-binding protein [bacterium]